MSVAKGAFATFATGEVTHKIEITSCELTSTLHPCTAAFAGTIHRAARSYDYTLSGRLSGGYFLCQITKNGKRGSGLTVKAESQKPTAKKFSTLKSGKTNTKGIASFDTRKLPKGTKLRCSFNGTKLSNVVKIK